ncbi:MAG: hypothetical protein PWQ12_572 [Clostridiales bacterium]|jgi:transglutaminase-like putative cysteine protease|nr:hypothetical protein [Clostridiales bacterium]
MKKWMYTTIFFIALFIGTSSAAFALSAVPSMGTLPISYEITLSGTSIPFAESPIAINGVIMVPAQTFFESVGAQVYWIESEKTLVAYRDNVFLKYTGNSDRYTLNGLEKSLSVSAIMRGGTLFVPLTSATQSLSLNYTIDTYHHIAAIDYRETAYQYMQIGYNHYKRINLASWGISYYVPEFWTLIDGTYATYGFATEYESYQLEPTVLPLEAGFDRGKLTEALKSNLQLEYGDQLSFGNTKLLEGNTYTARTIYYTITDDDGVVTHYVLYVFYENNIGYVFTGQYGDINNLTDSEDVFDTIAKTFQINKLSINEQLEHYIELNRFFSVGMHLSSDLYSNMRVENQFRFSGSVDASISGMHVLVTREEEQMEFYVPVVDGSFDAVIYTPFGLGKHNITVALDDTSTAVLDQASANLVIPSDTKNPAVDENTETTSEAITPPSIDEIVDAVLAHTLELDTTNTVMKFSVINVSSEAIKNLLPTEFVNYDHPDVYAASNAVTYNLTSNYAKARALYQWVYENYTYSTIWSEEGIRTTEQLVHATDGNAVELCVLYTGLLRANDIPARIVRGSAMEDSRYWVEAYINGKWLVADIPIEVLSKDDTGIHYFNVSTTLQYQDFDTVEDLSF